ncbi:hypothetical protein BZG36_04176 [Bifiguratus adelaidae]|uniref:Pentacotripeptide-repeat region of PRORP domain-containing protein n=1 Tax=Bifiguratus adelaidae TaxID=1938954 RepID=A0A261XZ00_9FUNG|nr:hypothetical protein BZG36_04176 [Bifiguratus adelaidae]
MSVPLRHFLLTIRRSGYQGRKQYASTTIIRLFTTPAAPVTEPSTPAAQASRADISSNQTKVGSFPSPSTSSTQSSPPLDKTSPPGLRSSIIAHKEWLLDLVKQNARQVGQYGRIMRPTIRLRNEFASLLESWNALEETLGKQSNQSMSVELYNHVVEFSILANRIDSEAFPMLKAESIVKDMKARGFEPNYKTYLRLMRGYARTHEFNEDTRNVRLDKALEVLYRMESERINIARPAVFQALLEACVPHTSRYQFDNFYLQSRLLQRTRSRPRLDERVFDIERMMLAAKIPHDRLTFKTIVTCLGVGGSYGNMWKRWKELQLSGLRRDEGLYQRVLALSSMDTQQAQYALTVIRHQMERESPRVQVTWGIYQALLDCCVASQDIATARMLLKEVPLNDQRDLEPLGLDTLEEQGQVQPAQKYAALVTLCLNIRGLESEAEHFIQSMKQNDIPYSGDVWQSMLARAVRTQSDTSSIDRLFNQWTMERFEKTGKIPIPALEQPRVVPFPSGPYTPLDIRMIDLYIQALIASENLTVMQGVLSVYSEQSTMLPISRDSVIKMINLAIKDFSVDTAGWIVREIAPKVHGQDARFRKWLRRVQRRFGDTKTI